MPLKAPNDVALRGTRSSSFACTRRVAQYPILVPGTHWLDRVDHSLILSVLMQQIPEREQRMFTEVCVTAYSISECPNEAVNR